MKPTSALLIVLQILGKHYALPLLKLTKHLVSVEIYKKRCNHQTWWSLLDYCFGGQCAESLSNLLSDIADSQRLTRGETAIFECSKSTEPSHTVDLIQVAWFKNKNLLYFHCPITKMTTPRFTSKRMSVALPAKLQISEVQKSGEGIYTCDMRTTGESISKRWVLITI